MLHVVCARVAEVNQCEPLTKSLKSSRLPHDQTNDSFKWSNVNAKIPMWSSNDEHEKRPQIHTVSHWLVAVLEHNEIVNCVLTKMVEKRAANMRKKILKFFLVFISCRCGRFLFCLMCCSLLLLDLMLQFKISLNRYILLPTFQLDQHKKK